jgi:hypothetical protein
MITFKTFLSCALIALLILTACSSGIKYVVKGDYKTDGELMEAALKAACDEVAKNPAFKTYKVVSIDNNESDKSNSTIGLAALSKLSTALLEREQEGTTNVVVKFIVTRCQTQYYDAGNLTRRVATASYHIIVEDKEDSLMLWAGDFEGQAEDQVPKGIAKKLIDTRYEQIGQTMVEESSNPYIEPLLVVGITGALIYLFTATAK